VVVPGSLEARYERVAGNPDHRAELYLARRRLGFSIREWHALSWWERRVYIEGMNNEAEDGTDGATGDSVSDRAMDAILGGTIGDVAASGFST
jgi:hypothetical protein